MGHIYIDIGKSWKISLTEVSEIWYVVLTFKPLQKNSNYASWNVFVPEGGHMFYQKISEKFKATDSQNLGLKCFSLKSKRNLYTKKKKQHDFILLYNMITEEKRIWFGQD